MNNPFKEILLHYDVPFSLKQKVLDDIHMIKLTLDISDLFILKYPCTVTGFWDVDFSKKRTNN